MISIAIYSNQSEDINVLKNIIQDFLIESKTVAKVSVFSDKNDIISIHNKYDVYFLDIDTEENTSEIIELSKELKDTDIGCKFVYVSNNINHTSLTRKVFGSFFITKPIDRDEIIEVLFEIKKEIKEDSIIIKIPSGERRIRINNLNYINIVKRCLCYHLKDGTMFDGQTLRSSFEKAISPLDKKKPFYFLPPSLLINLNEIKIINKDHAIFENDDVLFFPMKQRDNLRDAWITYNKID